MECFAVRDLSFSYPGEGKKALDRLTFSVGEGEFVVLAGPSGCGKSTLLRHLKTALTPHGRRSGEIFFEGRPLAEVGAREESGRIGFVMQSPDGQIVADKVWHELAFGLESLGLPTPVIRARVAEMAGFFGIEPWFYKDVSELSGGQKQLLSLASVMAMRPSVLLLDEPTGQLDPVAASTFLAAVGRINRELGTTVLLAEQRLEEVFPMSDRVFFLDRGKLLCQGTPQEVGAALRPRGDGGLSLFLPAPMRIHAAVPDTGGHPPVTVRDGRLWLEAYARTHPLGPVSPEEEGGTAKPGGEAAVSLRDVWFRYGKDAPDVIRGLSLEVPRGDFLAILGGNGAGKTTALSLIAGILKPYRGKIALCGGTLRTENGSPPRSPVALLPQDPQALFARKTVREELLEMLEGRGMTPEEEGRAAARVSRLCRLEGLLSRHPCDLSGGEKQRAALAKVLLAEPEILLLDEATKGLDALCKRELAQILERLLQSGVTVVMVSHDVEFCARYARRCALFFDGAVVAENTTRAFFAGNSLYATAAGRMARHLLPDAVTAEDVIAACGGRLPAAPPPPDNDDVLLPPTPAETGGTQKKLPRRRRLLALLSAAVACAAAALSLTEPDIPWLMDRGRLGLYAVFLFAALLFLCAVGRREETPIGGEWAPAGRRRLGVRTKAAAGMLLLAVPLTIWFGVHTLGDRKYYFISLLVLLETMLPFFLVFEGRKPRARELAVISVLCAAGVAGRAAFFMLPEFKPVAAVVIVSGVAFGGETGFLVGAVTMLVSNMLFMQGPWTPWQMCAMGAVGFLAGALFRKGLLRRSRLPLSVFGALSVLLVYGGVMNPANVLMYQANPTWPMFLSAYLTGFPFDLVHAAATFFFLWLLSRPMLEKLDRIKVKYGLLEEPAAGGPA